jgi:DNA transformation protein and related proteins
MPRTADPIAEFLRDQLRDWAPVAVRPLFGGWGLYSGAVMFGLLARDTVYFRVDDGNRPDFTAAGMPSFRYTMPTGKTIEMAYSEVPPSVLDDPEELARWAGKAHEAALRVRDKKKPAGRSRQATRARKR